MKVCPYCGTEILKEAYRHNNVFTHADITFHGDCRRQALENAVDKCQKELQQSLKEKK